MIAIALEYALVSSVVLSTPKREKISKINKTI